MSDFDPNVRTGTSTSDTAKEQASQVAGTAKDAAGDVLDETRAGVRDVAGEAQDQLRQLWDRTRDETMTQTGTQQQRLAEGVHSFAGDLRSMLDGANDGVAAELVRRVAEQAERTGDWLARGTDEVIADVRRFARRRPGTFLLVAAGAGIAVGRLSRSLKDAPSGRTTPAHRAGQGSGEHVAAGSYGTTAGAYQPAGAGADVPHPTGPVTPGTPLGTTPPSFAPGSLRDEVQR